MPTPFFIAYGTIISAADYSGWRTPDGMTSRSKLPLKNTGGFSHRHAAPFPTTNYYFYIRHFNGQTMRRQTHGRESPRHLSRLA